MVPEAEGDKKSRRRTIVRFWLRLVCFTLILALVLAYAGYVLTPKYDYGISSMANLYLQKRNTVDVLVLGTSLAYTGVNTNVLWAEYGIASYDLCSAEQPYWNSYYDLVEALKLQSPRLIILDARASGYTKDYQKWGRVTLNTYGILSPVTRFQAIVASARPEDLQDCLLAFPLLHSNYTALTWSDFQYPPANDTYTADWKGFIGMDVQETHTRPSLVWTDTEKAINARQLEYLEKIILLAQERQIPLLLVGFPNPDYANVHMYYNTLWSVADEYGVDYINFNDPDLRFGLRYTTDFADWQHLDIKGSITFTRQLGKMIDETYALPDRRDDAAYASYDACFTQWQAQWPDFAASVTE